VLDTIQSLLVPLASRDLDVAEIADAAGAVMVVLALPSWEDYLQTALDDLIEAASRSPMVLLRAGAARRPAGRRAAAASVPGHLAAASRRGARRRQLPAHLASCDRR